jgi:hypothetical protein
MTVEAFTLTDQPGVVAFIKHPADPDQCAFKDAAREACPPVSATMLSEAPTTEMGTSASTEAPDGQAPNLAWRPVGPEVVFGGIVAAGCAVLAIRYAVTRQG